MKRNFIFTVAVLATISGCTTKLSPQDQALLAETRNLAQQAVSQSAMAIAEAKAAREGAERAAMEAASSGKKADRIFRESQQK